MQIKLHQSFPRNDMSQSNSSVIRLSVVHEISELYELDENTVIAVLVFTYFGFIVFLVAVCLVCFFSLRKAYSTNQRRPSASPSANQRPALTPLRMPTRNSTLQRVLTPPPQYGDVVMRCEKELYCCTPPPRFSTLMP